MEDQNQILHQNSDNASSAITNNTDGSLGKAHDFSSFLNKFQTAVDDDDELEELAELGDNVNNENEDNLNVYQNPGL